MVDQLVSIPQGTINTPIALLRNLLPLVSIPQGTINTTVPLKSRAAHTVFPFRKVQLILTLQSQCQRNNMFPFRKVQLIQL